MNYDDYVRTKIDQGLADVEAGRVTSFEDVKKEFNAILNEGSAMKQMIVLRKDLGMRKGKMIAQGAHASMKATLENLNHPSVKEWLKGPFTKIAVSVDSEDELMQVYEKAKESGLICSLILDAGRTEFNGVPTYTAIGVGPATNEELEPITGHLKLL